VMLVRVRLGGLLCVRWRGGRQEQQGENGHDDGENCNGPSSAGTDWRSVCPAQQLRHLHRALHFIAEGVCFQSQRT
jgi:hypothetical protein